MSPGIRLEDGRLVLSSFILKFHLKLTAILFLHRKWMGCLLFLISATAGSTSSFLLSVIMNLIALDYLHEDSTSTLRSGRSNFLIIYIK